MRLPIFDPSHLIETPLLQALVERPARLKVSAGFHMPGHAGMRAWPDWLQGGLAQFDTTELPTSDDLLHPREEGPVVQAERLAAGYWGAGKTLLLTGGATQGLQVMLRLICQQGDSVWVDRYQHKSIFHACQLQDLRPAYGEVRRILLEALEREEVEPDGSLQEASSSMERLTRELDRLEQVHPAAKAYLIQSPDYYGRQLPLRSLAKVLHDTGRVLLVDEAHGAIRAGQLRDKRALQQGADLVTQSGHKTTAALTPGAWLHLGHDYLSMNPRAGEQARETLDLIATSSPSLLIAASLDYARWSLERSEALLTTKETKIRSFGERLRAETPFELMEASTLWQTWTDPLRLRIYSPTGLSGPQLQDALSERGIDVEAAYADHILLLVSLYQDDEDLDRLLEILEALDAPSRPSASPAKHPQITVLDKLLLPEIVYEPAEALALKRSDRMEYVHWQEAENRIVLSEVMPYPPGVPLLLPGERASREFVAMMEELVKNQVHLNGLDATGQLAVLSEAQG